MEDNGREALLSVKRLIEPRNSDGLCASPRSWESSSFISHQLGNLASDQTSSWHLLTSIVFEMGENVESWMSVTLGNSVARRSLQWSGFLFSDVFL